MKILPWLVTVAALYFAFRGVDIAVLLEHAADINFGWLLVAFAITVASYSIRAYRWPFLLPNVQLSLFQSYRVLILGFFMNNVLPARAGEFVRAHMGAKVTGEKRTLVLASVAAERLVDGLAISIMFVIFAFGLGDAGLSENLLLVAGLFGIAAVGVLAILWLREPLFELAAKISERFDHKASSYTLDRLQVFINGLAPMFSLKRLPIVSVLSFLVWGVELTIYYGVSRACGLELSWSQLVLLMVAVNFSSLIPAAPGGIGVIEAVGSAVLVSIGIGQEQALMTIICQHLTQFLAVGIPGAWVMLTWRQHLPKSNTDPEIESEAA